VFLAARCVAAFTYARQPVLRGLLRTRLVEREVLRGYLREVPTYLGIVVCASLVSRLDVLLLSRLSTPEQLGWYAAPSRLYELGLMVPQVIVAVLYPHLVALKAAGSQELPRVVGAAAVLPLLAGVPVLIAIAWHAGLVLQVFKIDAAPAAAALALLLAAMVVMGLNQLLATCMMVYDQQLLDLRALVTLCAVQGLALLAVVPRWGAAGAAAVVLGTLMLVTLLRARWVGRQLSLAPLWRGLLDIMWPALAMVSVLVLLRAAAVWLSLGLALALYAVVAALSLRRRAAEWHGLGQALTHRAG
jgi:O-antigen/teichoic acid export membrane protein